VKYSQRVVEVHPACEIFTARCEPYDTDDIAKEKARYAISRTLPYKLHGN
jgi:hypothetical protein